MKAIYRESANGAEYESLYRESANGAEYESLYRERANGAEYESQGQAPTARNMKARGKREARRPW